MFVCGIYMVTMLITVVREFVSIYTYSRSYILHYSSSKRLYKFMVSGAAVVTCMTI